MPSFPLGFGGVVRKVPSSGYYVDMTAPGSAHVKSSWVEMISSTPIDAGGLIIAPMYSDLNTTYLVDVAVGAGGSEQVLLANLMVQAGGAKGAALPIFYFPVQVPEGVRLASRCQASAGSRNIGLVAYLLGGSFGSGPRGGRARTYGANTGTSRGTEIDPGGTMNTKGSWTEITSATSAPIGHLVAVFGKAPAAGVDLGWMIDIGVGAGGSEQVLVPNIGVIAQPTAVSLFPCAVTFPVTVPAGERLSARAQASISATPSRLIDVQIIGVD